MVSLHKPGVYARNSTVYFVPENQQLHEPAHGSHFDTLVCVCDCVMLRALTTTLNNIDLIIGARTAKSKDDSAEEMPLEVSVNRLTVLKTTFSKCSATQPNTFFVSRLVLRKVLALPSQSLPTDGECQNSKERVQH